MTINKFILNDPCISEYGPVKHCQSIILWTCIFKLMSWFKRGTFYYKSNETLVVFLINFII